MLFGTYYRSTVFETRRRQTWNDFGQVTNVCLSWITRAMDTDYEGHAQALMASMCWVGVDRELKWLSDGTLDQAGLLPRATASNSCRKHIGLLKLSLDSSLYLKIAERGVFFFFFFTILHKIENLNNSICWL